MMHAEPKVSIWQVCRAIFDSSFATWSGYKQLPYVQNITYSLGRRLLSPLSGQRHVSLSFTCLPPACLAAAFDTEYAYHSFNFRIYQAAEV